MLFTQEQTLNIGTIQVCGLRNLIYLAPKNPTDESLTASLGKAKDGGGGEVPHMYTNTI